MLFIKKLQAQPKVKSVKREINRLKAKQKQLSNQYRKVLKSEASRLGKAIRKSKRSKRNR